MYPPENPTIEQTVTDAAHWRELMILLQRKAYRAMTPVEIAEQLPDLRAVYRAAQNHSTSRAWPF
jgi:hypothetical protein